MKIKKPYSCGLGPVFDMIGGRWKAAILWELSQQEMRFGELRRALGGITEKMLIQQLKELEQHNLIKRIDYQEMPLRVGYVLTDEGMHANELMLPLAEWGKTYSHKLGIATNYTNITQ